MSVRVDLPVDALEAARSALAEPFADGEIRMVTLAAPAAAPEAMLRLAGADSALVWDAAAGPAVAGWGAAHVIGAVGEHRFERVRAEADAFWPRIRSVAAPGVAPLPARLYGGFSFLAAPSAPAWNGFGQAGFVLPRLVYSVDGDGARVALAVTSEEAASGDVDGILAPLTDAFRLLSSPAPEPRAVIGARPVSAPDVAGWTAAVESIRDRIAAGDAEKIVAARIQELEVPGGADAAAVLRGLRTATAAEARFAFRRGDATFVGATPERLISRRGLEVRTEALAGSMDADHGERAEELLGSLKDAAEHAYVVRAIADAIGPLCEHLDYPAEPRIQRLRHVLHLQTPFVGRLETPVHVLELVERLHPTPAVGGTPRAAALEWIAEHEPWTRGWYASPVGWFDANGDGDFVVALRSALLRGERALLYGGAGIVRESDPAAELEETTVKLRTMGDVLGWTP